MKKELLVTCLLCGQGNFTTRGLRQHWCPAKPAAPGHHKHSAPITKEEWQDAVNAARRDQCRGVNYLMKIEIKHWWTGGVLFEHDAEKNTIKLTVEAAVKARASLDGASLDGASLDGARLDGARLDGARLVGASLVGARLVGARLDGASLDGASLVGARLVGARLDGASLDGASLDGASLDGARLDGARLDGASLVGARLVGARLDGASLDDGSKISKCERPIFQIGGLGSAFRYFVAHLTDKGIRLRTGCFFGSIADFRAKLKITHKDNTHTFEYDAAIALIEAHFKLWPKVK